MIRINKKKKKKKGKNQVDRIPIVTLTKYQFLITLE